MKRTFRYLPLAALFLCLLATPSLAHKVYIFAYVENGRVYTESGYSKKKRVYEASVEVYDPDTNELLLSGTTDKEGCFDFPVPAHVLEKGNGLLLVLKAGEGHQGQWKMEPSEFTSTAPETPHEAPDTEPGVMEVLIGLAIIAVLFGGFALIRSRRRSR